MPCDLGYRSVSEVKIAKVVANAPKLDRALLARLGQTDPAFIAWIEELDPLPLQQKALERALAATGASGEFRIENGALIGPPDREDVGKRWQIELLRIVAEVLDFDLTLTQSRDGSLVLEGEKTTGADVQEYLRINIDEKLGAELRFEHFKSEEEVANEEDRFLVLADKLGVRVVILRQRRSGQDIPKGAVHRHPHKGKGKA